MTQSVFLPLAGNASTIVGLQVTPVMVFQLNDVGTHSTASRGQSREARAARIAANLARRDALAQGRRRLAKAVARANDGEMGLAELRLEAGLSQADVAKAMQTHQPNVARQERRPGDLHLSALRLWAAVLGCDVTKVMAAVDISNRRNHEQ